MGLFQLCTLLHVATCSSGLLKSSSSSSSSLYNVVYLYELVWNFRYYNVCNYMTMSGTYLHVGMIVTWKLEVMPCISTYRHVHRDLSHNAG